MEAVFLRLLNMSITAGWLALAVMLLRLPLKRASKWITCILWALVAVRLVCPFSVESTLSLIPSAETVPLNITTVASPTIHSGIQAVNFAVNPVLAETLSPAVSDSANPMQLIVFSASIVWIVGCAALLCRGFISWLRIRGSLREAMLERENIWLCDNIPSPFILGIFRPRIFLPSYISEADARYVLAHEQAHLQRYDNIWRPLGYLLLCVYWFNPLLWIAYALLCRDIELACDEKVLVELGADVKKEYSKTLISCSAPCFAPSSCPLAFGESGVKTRIKNILNYKKSAFPVIIVALIICAVLTLCMLTNPISYRKPLLDYAEYKQGYVSGYEHKALTDADARELYALINSSRADVGRIDTPGCFLEFETVSGRLRLLGPSINNEFELKTGIDSYHFANSALASRVRALVSHGLIVQTTGVYQLARDGCVYRAAATVSNALNDVTNAAAQVFAAATKRQTDAGVSYDEGCYLITGLTPFSDEPTASVRYYVYLSDGEARMRSSLAEGYTVISDDIYDELAARFEEAATPASAENTSLSAFLEATIRERTGFFAIDGSYICIDIEPLSATVSGDKTTVYMMVLAEQYSFDGKALKLLSGFNMPVAITAESVGSSYKLIEYWTPRDGAFYIADIETKLPKEHWKIACGSQEQYELQKARNLARADAFFGLSSGEPAPSVREMKRIYTYACLTANAQAYLSLSPSDGRFMFSVSPFCTHLETGSYTLNGDRIIARTPDGEAFSFRQQDSRIIFIADESSAIPIYTDTISDKPTLPLPDEAELILRENQIAHFADIDGDGIEEACTIEAGKLAAVSWTYSFAVKVYENGRLEYAVEYNGNPYYQLSFVEKNGRAAVRGVSNYNYQQTHIFDLVIKDDKLYLMENGAEIERYHVFKELGYGAD